MISVEKYLSESKKAIYDRWSLEEQIALGEDIAHIEKLGLAHGVSIDAQEAKNEQYCGIKFGHFPNLDRGKWLFTLIFAWDGFHYIFPESPRNNVPEEADGLEGVAEWLEATLPHITTLPINRYPVINIRY